MKTVEEIVHNINHCIGVTDEEVAFLYKKYEDLRNLLREFSPRYDLALFDVNRKNE